MEDMQNDYSPHESYPIFRSHLPYVSNMEFAFDRQAILDEGRHLQNATKAIIICLIKKVVNII